ncbi:6-carboxytetrahydropterin synthase [Idiomarina xiamenensis]|uniref:6-carboxy-5,6,7,8-tetrahydropterin synthase n=1 Tax=Idiomarina xiamenensis 10-D-4 TaxID=740709 RepID=K2LB65_9GAMM|nr:6-carboxytetrahydropterin synthase [Idiomarina xiamenensis]EKE87050.1 hypothetical protein A10D4_02372 [Idiomarina xiamenensis 10-D-4]
MQLFVNDLTVIDFSYLCARRGIVGESWIVDIVLDGDLNEQSMVLDFGRVKKQIKRIIDDAVDHKLAVPADSTLTQVTHNQDDSAYWVDFNRPDGRSIHLYCPADAYAFIEAEQIDQASVMAYLRAVIKQQLPDNIDGLQLFLRAESIDGFYYHYTHGLKKHDGNCQRIAHGHRSKIHIALDDIRQPALEKQWSDRWCDIYLGSEEDTCKVEQLTRSAAAQGCSDDSHQAYRYHADQGLFELLVPQAENDLIPTDSTVECIAQFVADSIKRRHPQQRVKVLAYEGVGKGAIAYA